MPSFNGRSTADEVVAATPIGDKRYLVTGGNSGIGLETARALAAGGAEVWLGCRSVERGQGARQSIVRRHPHADVRVLELDLGSLASVRRAADSFEPNSLDGLIANAGVFGGGYATTAEGYERCVGICHIGHFLLVNRLLDKLERAGGRVVMVSSESHRNPKRLDFDNFPLTPQTYSDFVAYGQAKLCNVLFANELDRRLQREGKRVRANSLHPGTLIGTSIDRSSLLAKVGMMLARPFTRSLAQGAATSCYVAVSPDLDDVGGAYFDKCRPRKASDEARDPEVAQRLWALTEKWVD